MGDGLSYSAFGFFLKLIRSGSVFAKIVLAELNCCVFIEDNKPICLILSYCFQNSRHKRQKFELLRTKHSIEDHTNPPKSLVLKQIGRFRTRIV